MEGVIVFPGFVSAPLNEARQVCRELGVSAGEDDPSHGACRVIWFWGSAYAICTLAVSLEYLSRGCLRPWDVDGGVV